MRMGKARGEMLRVFVYDWRNAFVLRAGDVYSGDARSAKRQRAAAERIARPAALSSQTLLTAARKGTRFPPETLLPEAAERSSAAPTSADVGLSVEIRRIRVVHSCSRVNHRFRFRYQNWQRQLIETTRMNTPAGVWTACSGSCNLACTH